MEYQRANLADVSLPVIGIHHSPMTQKFGLPRQSNLVNVSSVIELLPPYNLLEAVMGLENFSHLWLHWYFHANRQSSIKNEHSKAQFRSQFRSKIRPPRLGGNDKIGVFASRSMYRPSQTGMSVVCLQGIEMRQSRLLIHIMGADLLDKTPILDIRPYIGYSDAITDSQSGYAKSKPLTCQVYVHENAKQQFEQIVVNVQKNRQKDLSAHDSLLMPLNETDWQTITALICQDPRPAYRQHPSDRVYVMRYKNIDVQFMQTVVGRLDVIGVNEIA